MGIFLAKHWQSYLLGRLIDLKRKRARTIYVSPAMHFSRFTPARSCQGYLR